jgi:hypothetical protein
MASRAIRFSGSVLGAGVVGGMVTAALAVLFLLEPSPVAHVLAYAAPAVLLALVGWRIAASTGLAARAPSDRLLVGAAGVSVAVIALLQGLTEIDGVTPGDVGQGLGVILFAVILGGLYGLFPAVAIVLAGLPAVLWLPRTAALIVVTALAMAAAAGFALLVGAELNTGIVTGLAAALAGIAAVLTAPAWLPEQH